MLTSASKFNTISHSHSNLLANVKVIVGANDITKSEANKRVYKVKKILTHPKYTKNSLDYDFAMMELEQPPEGFSSLFRPICLPNKHTPLKVKDAVTAAGWGVTSTSKYNEFFKFLIIIFIFL